MRKIRKRSLCPVSSALDVLGDKWSLLVVRDIVFEGKSTFGDFKGSAEKISTNILSDRLAVLEHSGILTKTEHPTNKTKYVYALTRKGTDLIPLLLEMIVWSDKYHVISEPSKELARRLRMDKQAVLVQLSSRLANAAQDQGG